MSPGTTNFIKRPAILEEVHDDANTRGHSNVCSKLLGESAGARLDILMCKHLVWLCAMITVCTIIATVHTVVPTSLAYSISMLVLAVLLALCLNVNVLKKLVRVLGVWYFILSLVGGTVSNIMIFGPRYWTVDGNNDSAR